MSTSPNSDLEHHSEFHMCFTTPTGKVKSFAYISDRPLIACIKAVAEALDTDLSHVHTWKDLKAILVIEHQAIEEERALHAIKTRDSTDS